MRHWVGWPAVYRVEGRGHATWSRCRLVDVSESGASVALFGRFPVAVGDRLTITLQRDHTTAIDDQLVGSITRVDDTTADQETRTIVGISVLAWPSGTRDLVASSVTLSRSA